MTEPRPFDRFSFENYRDGSGVFERMLSFLGANFNGGQNELNYSERKVSIKRLYCYVDEFGDIGTSHKSSPVFVLGAVLVPEEHVDQIRETIQKLRSKLAQSSDQLHWSENARSWDRRQAIVKEISTLPIKIVFVNAVKTDLRAQSHAYEDPSPALMWSMQLLTERILLAARDWEGGSRELHLILSRIKGVHDERIHRQFEKMKSLRNWVPWYLLHKKIQILNNSRLEGLQLADQVCGAFKAALLPGELSERHEIEHFKELIHLIRRGPDGGILTYGIKETSPFLEKLSWWTELERDLTKTQDAVD